MMEREGETEGEEKTERPGEETERWGATAKWRVK